MDAIELLTSQHHTLEALLKTVASILDVPTRHERLLKVADAMALHLAAEESLLYPAMRSHRLDNMLLEALEEHLSIKRLLADLLLEPGSATFDIRLRMLCSEVEHHHLDEETRLFPMVRQVFDSARRSELGLRMEQLQLQLLRQGRPRDVAVGSVDPLSQAGAVASTGAHGADAPRGRRTASASAPG